MAKKPPQPHSDLIEIATWNEADDILKTIGSLQMKINALESDATDRINEIKAELQDETNPTLNDIRRLAMSLQAFCENHKEDFGGLRSRSLQFGVVGWRLSTSISVCKKTIEKIKEYFGRKAYSYLRIKVEPNKDAMSLLDNAALKAVGAKRNEKDTFFAEPEIHESTDY
jgi:phage host-nuclease inhibitor protein Gam